MQTSLDHLVIVAPTLEVGHRFVSQRLGVELKPGGCHPVMGTHNRLLRLGTYFYLEVIAINPAASPADRPRWFGLDELSENAPPRLAHWVAKTDNLKALNSTFAELVGQAQPMSRGELCWDIIISAEGSLPLEGAAPSLIQWEQALHPATMLEDKGCSLHMLDIFHPAQRRSAICLMSYIFPDRFDFIGALASSRHVWCQEFKPQVG